MVNGHIISVRELVKGFHGQRVLDGLNLNVQEGVITTIIGKSGEGKSLILKHIMGLAKPDSGSVLVNGIDITRAGKRKLNAIRSRMGFLFQGAALFDSISIFENVALPLREKMSLKEYQIKQRVNEHIRLVGLEGAGDKYPHELSGGMRKRVGLARALITNPEIVLFDEPTTGLDPLRKNAIYELIMENQKRYGFSAVIVSHEISDIFNVSNRIAMLHRGRIILEGSPETFQKSTNPQVINFITGMDRVRCPETGLLMQEEFTKRLSQEYARANRYGSYFSLLMIKIDLPEAQKSWKEWVEDHETATAAREASRVIMETLRDSDFLARFGEQIFAVILPHTPFDGAILLGERIRRNIANATLKSFGDTEKRIVFGFSQYSPSKEPHQMVQEALKIIAAEKREDEKEMELSGADILSPSPRQALKVA